MAVLITGASRGIGRAMFDCYTSKGRDVIGTRRSGSAPGRWIDLDIGNPAQIAGLPTKLADTSVELLVCNAGIYPDKGQTLDHGYPAALWAEGFAINVTGVFLTIQALLPALRAARGKIAIISSQMASDERAPGGSYIYRASKAAALNLGRNLAADLRGDGVAVGIYHPGWVQTDMGGASAEITPEQAAAGLIQRFDALSVATTGCFETWDGRAHPF